MGKDQRQLEVPGTERLSSTLALRELEPHVEEGRGVVAFLKDYAVETQEDLEHVAEWLTITKAKRNWLEAREKEITSPINEGLKRVRELFKPAKTLWADIELALKAKVAAARLLEEQHNKDALSAAADAHAQGDAKGTVAAIATMTNSRDLAGVSTRMRWTYIIDDASQLPREFTMPNEKLLKEHCSHATKGEPTPIPGVRFVPGVTVSATAAKEHG